MSINPVQYRYAKCLMLINPFMGTLKPQSNEPLYNNTVLGFVP